MHTIFSDYVQLSLVRVNTNVNSVHSLPDKNFRHRADDMDGTREWSSDVEAMCMCVVEEVN